MRNWRKFNENTESRRCAINITSEAISRSRCSDTFWIANSISGDMSRTGRLVASPALPRLHLYLFTFRRASFASSSRDRCLCRGTLLCTIARPFTPSPPSLSLGFALSTYTRIRACLNACTCIHQAGWRVTRCSPGNTYESQGCRESAPRSGITHPRVPYAARGAVYNTRACRAQANRRAYSSRENARAKVISPPYSRSRRRLLVVADGNYSSATSRKIQGHDYLAPRARARIFAN